MSRTQSSDSGRNLRADFEKLRVAWRTEPVQLQPHPDYPEELVLVSTEAAVTHIDTSEDWRSWHDRCTRLLEQAYEREPAERGEEDVLLKRASDAGRRGHRTALYRLEGTAYQISDRQPHDQLERTPF